MPDQVSLPPVEASFEASRPFFTAVREAVETLQGLRGGVEAALALPQISGLSRSLGGNTLVSDTTPATVQGMVFPVKKGHTYHYRFLVAFRTKAGNLDLGVKIARPDGAHLGRVVVSNA